MGAVKGLEAHEYKMCTNCNGTGIDLFSDQNGVYEDNCEICEGTGEIPDYDEEE